MSKKQNIIEGIGFVLMVLSIITLIGAMYELKEVSKDVRELRTIMRKQYINQWYIKINKLVLISG